MMQNFRLVPARKLPALPPRGERFGGLLRPSTLIWLGVAVVLVGTVVTGVLVSRPSAPTTLQGATTEVLEQADELQGLFDPAAVDVVDEQLVEPCADGSAKQQFRLVRTVTPAAGFDRTAFEQTVREAYEARGWHVGVEQAGAATIGGPRTMSLIGINLVPITLTLPAVEASPEITVASTSRCVAG